jgi:tripartite-type tricarboxylate transporter receptor subunit TctC
MEEYHMVGFWRGMKMAVAGATVLAASTLAATAFPTKPITMVVPFAAGGPSDTIARLFAAAMSQQLGGQIIVENVAGAGSTLGIGRVAKAEPDGHTLLVSHISHATTATLYKNLSYNAADDFSPIGMMTDGAFVLVAKKDFPAANIQEVIARIRSEGEKIAYAHAGVGSGSHLCGLMIMQATGKTMNQIPYRGTGPALNDVVGGKVDLLCDQITSALPQIQGNTVKAYAVTSPTRVAALPLPTMAEAGMPGFKVMVFHGLYAPKGTPQPVVDRLNAALRATLKDPNILARLEQLSTIPATEAQATPAHLGKLLRDEIAAWKVVIEKFGVVGE